MKKTHSVKRLIRAAEGVPSQRNSLASGAVQLKQNETLELHSNFYSMRQLDDLSGSDCIDYRYEKNAPDILVISQSEPPPTESGQSNNDDLYVLNEENS